MLTPCPNEGNFTLNFLFPKEGLAITKLRIQPAVENTVLNLCSILRWGRMGGERRIGKGKAGKGKAGEERLYIKSKRKP